VSEVIENFIRRRPGISRDEALEEFLGDDRIATWIGGDASRRTRLENEFARVWEDVTSGPLDPSSAAALDAPEVISHEEGDARPPADPRTLAPKIPSKAAPPTPPVRRIEGAPPARRLDLLCPNCAAFDVWSEDGIVACHNCHAEYDNMLDLVPVEPVGPFAFLFGDGWMGWVTAAGLTAALAILYLVLRM